MNEMKEKIEAIKGYLKYFPNDDHAKDNLMLCEYADELGLELNRGYYPRIDWIYCLVNQQIKIGKKCELTNSATKYKQNGNDTIVIWHESSGRLAFVNNDYWLDIEDEWQEFKNVLKSYDPLDYDEINNTYIYDVKNGKRLIANYNKIVDDFTNKVNKKVKEIQLKRKKEQFEQLRIELESELESEVQ